MEKDAYTEMLIRRESFTRKGRVREFYFVREQKEGGLGGLVHSDLPAHSFSISFSISF